MDPTTALAESFRGMIGESVRDMLGDGIDAHVRELMADAARLEALRRKETLTEKEVSELYGVKSGTLRNWRCHKIGPAYIKANGVVLYSAKALRDWIASNEVKTGG